METTVDMTYRFTQDDEPTDEQLLVIMKEVAEDVRLQQIETARIMRERFEREVALAKQRGLPE